MSSFEKYVAKAAERAFAATEQNYRDRVTRVRQIRDLAAMQVSECNRMLAALEQPADDGEGSTDEF